MSMFGTSGRLIRSSNVVKAGYCSPVLAFLSSRPQGHCRRPCSEYARSYSTLSFDDFRDELIDNYFISAFVKASTCSHHTQSRSTASTSTIPLSVFQRPRRNNVAFFEANTQSYHTATPRPPGYLDKDEDETPTRDNYLDMLDYYRETYNTDTKTEWAPTGLPEVEIPQTTSEALDTTGEEGSQPNPYNKIETFDVDTTGQTAITERLTKALFDETISNEELFKIYQALPFPGVSHLVEDTRHTLLRRLSIMEKKNQNNSFWFLSVVDDMKAANLPLNSGEWSSAIHLAGRSFSKVSAVEVEAALNLWKSMEQEAGVRGTAATFNILFDIATKAGKFVLAEMILAEMAARSLPLNRFAHVGLIYYYGVRGDGDGVRNAYRTLVNAGQTVDTAVLNCVIAALLKAGEPAPAEQVYERMKLFHAQHSGRKLPSNDWAENRDIGRVLARAARTFRTDPEKRQRLQDEQSLAPDLRTFAVLLSHHTTHTGELQRVAALLDDMRALDLPIRGRFFMELFRGFANHGWAPYSLWTRARLESVWASFLEMVDGGAQDVLVEKWIVIWTLRAFVKCCGEERTLEVWEELKRRWKHEVEEEVLMGEIVRVALQRRGG